MIRVYLIDDHPVVRDGFKRLLAQTGRIQVVGDHGEPEPALQACQALLPEVVVLDLSLGQQHGLDCLVRLRQALPQARVLVFSMHDAPALVKKALDLGAAGFVSKQAQPDTLVEAVLAVHSGQTYLSADVASRLRRPANASEALLASLSPKEMAVFRCLAQGLSVAASAQQLGLSAKTVSNHQTTIKEKLQVETTAALVHIALEHAAWVAGA